MAAAPPPKNRYDHPEQDGTQNHHQKLHRHQGPEHRLLKAEATRWCQQPKYLLRDRDCRYGGSFNPRAARLGIEGILTPVQAPTANAIAERLIGMLGRECLDHLIIINERHLWSVLGEYVAYYNGGRPHRPLRLETPTGPPARAGPPAAGRIIARPVLGGLHHEYEWLVA